MINNQSNGDGSSMTYEDVLTSSEVVDDMSHPQQKLMRPSTYE